MDRPIVSTFFSHIILYVWHAMVWVFQTTTTTIKTIKTTTTTITTTYKRKALVELCFLYILSTILLCKVQTIPRNIDHARHTHVYFLVTF